MIKAQSSIIYLHLIFVQITVHIFLTLNTGDPVKTEKKPDNKIFDGVVA